MTIAVKLQAWISTTVYLGKETPTIIYELLKTLFNVSKG